MHVLESMEDQSFGLKLKPFIAILNFDLFYIVFKALMFLVS